jgi:hypothetical protein
MKHRQPLRGVPLVAALALTAAGCGLGTDVEGPANVSLNFRVRGLEPVPAAAAAPGGPALVAGPPMAIDGTNGSLTINEIRLIVDEVELHLADDSCDDDGFDGSGSDDFDDDCDEFEAPPRFVDLPLDGEPIEAVRATIPPGTYDEIEFEIEDLDDDDDGERAAAIAGLRAEIVTEIPDWPRKASALVTGSFTPTGADPIDFRVFLEAEIEVEMDLVPSLVVGDDGSASRSLTVDVRPDHWFVRADGSVLPLHLFDHSITGDLLEIEVEMENGFTEIEIG